MAAFSAAMAGASSMRGWSPAPATSWTMKVPTDGCRDRGFGASRGPAEKIMVPDRSAENAMAAFSDAMVAFNSIYPAFSGAGPDYGAPTRRRPRPSTRTLSVELIPRARQTDLFIKKGKTHIVTKTSIRQSAVPKFREFPGNLARSSLEGRNSMENRATNPMAWSTIPCVVEQGIYFD